MAERITVKRAAELTGLSQLTVREGIKSGRLEFGRAIPSPTGRHNTIHISPAKLAEYLGLTVDEVKGGPKQ
jgi:excisionase family DNA binding protein